MHVEFRLCEISKVCAFDTQSFYRIQQLANCSTRQSATVRPTRDERDGASLSLLDRVTRREEDEGSAFTSAKEVKLLNLSRFKRQTVGKKCGINEDESEPLPTLRVEFAFEGLVKLVSSDLSVRRERVQHEKLIDSDWDGSEVRTRRYAAHPNEVILASLPHSMSDAVVKIRLLQLAPPLSDRDERMVRASLHDKWNVPICLGLAKITLKELFTISGGVYVALQPKDTVTRLVEGRNLNTVATNCMFGKDIGGSAFLTFQVSAYSFSQIPSDKLLLCRNLKSSLPSAIEVGNAEHPSTVSNAQEQIQVGSFDTPAVRFLLIPYMAVVDTALRLSSTLMWRRPAKTLALIAVVMLALSIDILTIALCAILLLEVVTTLRTMSSFFSTPIAEEESYIPSSSPISGSNMCLYGRRRTLLNALVRARIFFSRGLQTDCYYELALVFHVIRRDQVKIATCCASSLLLMLFFSTDFLVVVLLVAALMVHPFRVCSPSVRHIRNKPAMEVVQSIWRSIQINQPLRVSAVVQVLEQKPALKIDDGDGISSSRSGFARYGGLLSPSTCGSNKAFTHHQRSRTLDGIRGLSVLDRQLLQTASHLAFAVIAITFDGGASTPVTKGARSALCGPLISRLHRQFILARRLRCAGDDHTVPMADEEASECAAPLDDRCHRYFREVINLLSFIRRQCTMQILVSPSAAVAVPVQDSDQLRLDLFVKPAWLLEKGEDDGITSTLLSLPCNNLTVSRLSRCDSGPDHSARTLAVLASHFLQGSSLSIYSSGADSKTCCVIAPLEPTGLPRLAEPNPCPLALFKALEDVWHGSFSGESASKVTADMVLKLISSFRESWATTISEGSNQGRAMSIGYEHRRVPSTQYQPSHPFSSPHGGAISAAGDRESRRANSISVW